MAVTKLSLYNDTCILLGQRVLLLVTDDIEIRYDLDALYDNGAVDYCLEIVKPNYASKVDLIAGSNPSAQTTFAFQIDLPDADFVALAETAMGEPAIYRDGKFESLITRFVREADYILTDEASAYVRYIQEHATSFFASMPFSFGRVISSYMARELAWKYDPDAEEVLQGKLEQRIDVSKGIEQRNEPTIRGFSPDVLTDIWRYIYNDALAMLDKDPLISNTDDSVNKNRLSLALDNGLVGSVLEDTSWQFGLQSDQINYDPGADPEWGYPFVFDYPTDLHKINGVYVDEFMRNPLRDYIDEDKKIYAQYQTIYVEYVSTDFITTPQNWPDYFKRLVAARMAIDANVPGGNKKQAVQQYQTRRREAMSTNALSGPPKTLTQGSWSRSRGLNRGSNRNRP